MIARHEHLAGKGRTSLSVRSSGQEITLAASPGNYVDLDVEQAMKLCELLQGFVTRVASGRSA